MDKQETMIWDLRDAIPVHWVYNIMFNAYQLVLSHNVDVVLLHIRKQENRGWRVNLPRVAFSDSQQVYDTLRGVLAVCENYVGCTLTPPELMPEDRDDV